MAESDSKRVIALWNREIEDEIRRAAASDAAGRPWKAVVWTSLWVLWLLLLVAVLGHVKSLG